MANSWDQRLKVWDDAIRGGNAAQVRHELAECKVNQIPRDKVLAVAGICRRADFLPLGLRLLQPLVRPNKRQAVPATTAEKAEYASSLTRIGAGDEALQLLQSLDPAEAPEILIYQAYALIAQWDYRNAIPLLERYVADPRIDAYWKLIGELNLAAALVWETPGEKARPWLEKIVDSAKAQNLKLVLGNAMELNAQNAVLSERWDEAEEWLRQASELLKAAGGREEFFVRKWRAVARWKQLRTAPALWDLTQIRAEALSLKHWETVRQCDYFEADVSNKPESWLPLYFGTPYPAFRERLIARFGDELPKNFDWKLAAGTGQKECGHLDVALGRFSDSSLEAVKVGSLAHRLIVALSSDFYRPVRLATLHFRLYPDEFYNPISSPQRVHYAVQELRREIENRSLPLTVESDDGTFQLASLSPFSIRVPRHREEISPEHATLTALEKAWPQKEFSLRQASQILGTSSRTTLRILQKAIQDGALIRSGKAAATRYQFPKKTKRAA